VYSRVFVSNLVFHDIVGDGFNIDHVICAPSGIYTIECKTISKPVIGEAINKYDGKSIFIDGVKFDRDPLVQAKAQAEWLNSILSESAGKMLPMSWFEPIFI
jgi:hypothetical protein